MNQARPSFLSPIAVATRDGLRTYWGSALLVITGGAVALAAVLPVVLLAGTGGMDTSRLQFSSVRVSDLGFHWSPNASHPQTAQAEAIALLYQMLLLAAIATLLLAALSMLSISAARASARFPEIAVRRSVGASRRTLLQSAVAEGSVIAGAAVAIGVAGGIIGFAAARAGWPGTTTSGAIQPALLVGVGVVGIILIGALFQLLAAPSRRIVELQPHPLQLSIPAIQLGMGLTVLVASSMLVRHAGGLFEANAGSVGPGEVFEMESGSPATQGRAREYQAVLERLHRRPDVLTASLMSPGALVGLGMTDVITTDCGYCADGGVVIKWHLVFTTHHFVSADTFDALGIEKVEGRLLTGEDRWDTAPVAVISQGLARRHFQGGQAIGRQILLKLDKPEWYTVVGVVKDREPVGFGGKMQPKATIYLSILQHPPTTVDLLVRPGTRSAASPGNSEAAIISLEAGPVRWFGRWFSLLGWAMLIITAVTTFVLMRLWVHSLRPDLGLHRAAGARRAHIVRYILTRASLTGLSGVAIALWFGPALWNTLPEMVAGLADWDSGIVARLALVLIGIALAGALLPAIRVARMTPSNLIGSTGE